jgi:hypothetical protein
MNIIQHFHQINVYTFEIYKLCLGETSFPLFFNELSSFDSSNKVIALT